MLFYIWRRRQNRYKFKKEEIFDEILDRGHLDSDEQVNTAAVLNGSIIDEDEGTPNPYSQVIAINIS